MSKTILIAGYSRVSYIEKIRSYFSNESVTLICAYERQPLADKKKQFLSYFDEVYDLTKESDLIKFNNNISNIDCITCTQERDMVTYIKILKLSGKITASEADAYTTIIDKSEFKKSLKAADINLVPEHNIVNEELLAKLDTLTYPQIIKPSGLAGGIMIKKVNSPQEFLTHYRDFSSAMKDIAAEHYNKEIEIITESYIEGKQYSVNIYVNSSGEITFCPIVRIVIPQELGIDDTYSALQYTTDEINEEEMNELKKSVQQVVTHFGIKNISAHFDSVLHNGQWKFFEVGLRIGGNRQEQFELSHSMNHFYNDIMNKLGHKITIPKQKKYSCIVQKASIEHGTLKSIEYKRSVFSEDSPLITESKLAKINSGVKPLSLGGGTIVRFFIAGEEFENVLDQSVKLFKDIQFEVI